MSVTAVPRQSWILGYAKEIKTAKENSCLKLVHIVHFVLRMNIWRKNMCKVVNRSGPGAAQHIAWCFWGLPPLRYTHRHTRPYHALYVLLWNLDVWDQFCLQGQCELSKLFLLIQLKVLHFWVSQQPTQKTKRREITCFLWISVSYIGSRLERSSSVRFRVKGTRNPLSPPNPCNSSLVQPTTGRLYKGGPALGTLAPTFVCDIWKNCHFDEIFAKYLHNQLAHILGFSISQNNTWCWRVWLGSLEQEWWL